MGTNIDALAENRARFVETPREQTHFESVVARIGRAFVPRIKRVKNGQFNLDLQNYARVPVYEAIALPSAPRRSSSRRSASRCLMRVAIGSSSELGGGCTLFSED